MIRVGTPVFWAIARTSSNSGWATSNAPFKVPSRIAFADEQLPRNASGKILKRTLRDTYFGDGS